FARSLHDWTDDQCLTILGNCRRAVNPGGRILVVERLLPGAYATATDVNMLAVTGGRERSEAEFGTLMARSGFRLERVIPLPLEYNLIEGLTV
ncbi:MAG: methyltransferase, partial [Actinomycetota bacterium]